LIEVGAITAVSQAVTRIFRLSRVARLQVSVNRYIKLHAQLRAQDGLEQPAGRIASLIDLQVSDLVNRERTALARIYDWSTFGGALVASLILAVPMYWLVKYRYWWTTALLVIDALFIILFMTIGLTSIRKNPERHEQASLGPPQERIDGPNLPASS
jgi:hypothetical protein